MQSLKALLEEGILPSIGGDVWSQGGISIFGILVYWLDKDFNYHERLLGAIPFSNVRHTGDELEKATKTACADFGLGEYCQAGDNIEAADTVTDYIHGTVSDNASIIVSGWNCFDGHECCDHTLALVVKGFLEHPVVKKVFSKLRGMTAHFNHSVIGGNLLKECQRRHNMSESKPPQDNDTRSGWGGACKQSCWYVHNQLAIQMYDVENPLKASTAVANPDGSVYKTHQLLPDEWSIVREAMYLLTCAKTAVDLLQYTKKYERHTVTITNEAVKEAREVAYKDLCKRVFNDLMDCKLEDFAVATLLDPRHKSFKFKYAEKWMRGRFTKKLAETWANGIYTADWKPKARQGANEAGPIQRANTDVATEANFLASDSDSEEDELEDGPQQPDQFEELRAYLEMPDEKSRC
ncbi:hypothetical protein CYMTET_44395 [Cymbomonas tetramitiformis]|uniref:Uncharacterized protein n=1 Tax=Cymbomonas tetramitiformis TaxID=36881 RepID=A0AAE0C2D5_9CHLO|nr:hypothetical protein CYMTET_44395 [Cymbomonas tetramitiformis]